MQYTLDQLLDLLNSPIDSTKWGSDTNKILSLIRSIKTANCSSCMLRRKTIELNDLLSKYGDSVGRTTTYTALDPDNSEHRTPCPDCVAKHLATCMVLQSEFYQGYVDILPILESNLKEALDECPEDNKELKYMISSALRSVVVNKAPSIPIVLMDQFNDTDTTKTQVTHDNPPELSEIDLKNLSYGLNYNSVRTIKRILDKMPDYKDYNDTITRFDWAGRMNFIADIIAPRYSYVSRVIRARRLRCYDNPKDPTINPVWISCDDIKKALEDIA